MLVLKGLVAINLGYISYQDLKDREVYWFLFPSLMVLFALLHYHHVVSIHFVNGVLINLAIISCIMLLLFCYNQIRLKRHFFKEVFGVGDLLFFIAFALAFPTITFIVLFVFSLFFSLSLWLLLKHRSKHQHVPLAGYMSLFILLVLLLDSFAGSINLYFI